MKKILLFGLVLLSFLFPTVGFSDLSSNVLSAQKKLNELGFNAGVADGIWGNTTKNALIEFLSSKGIKFDGLLDENEFKILGISNARCKATPHKITKNKLAITWKQEINCPAEVFVAKDVKKSTKSNIEATLKAASDEWGNFGPIEYWVMGIDQASSIELIKKYCQRRAETGNMDFDYCLKREKNSDHGMLSYQKLGAEALRSKRPFGSAGHNGGMDWGIHKFGSSLPFGFEGKLDMPAGEDQKTVMHEYFHAVQHAHILDLQRHKRDKLWGPIWLVEGGAEYMASVTHEKLISEKKLDLIKNSKWEYDFRQSMQEKFRGAKEENKRHNCTAQMTKTTYNSPCRQFFYDGGAWAVAYLLNQTNENILLNEFYPNLEKLGWEGAFKKSFLKSSKEFYKEFAEFLKKDITSAMQIIPQY